MRLGRTVTVTTGVFCTVIAAMPDFPFAFAATCVEPMAIPVTTPDEETLAILESSTDHKTGTPLTNFPSASRTDACSGTCAPIVTVLVDGETTTAAMVPPPDWSTSVALPHAQTTIAAPHISPRRI